MGQDWQRIEKELGQLMPGIEIPAEQLSFPHDGGSANSQHGLGKRSTEAVLEHIAKALEDGKITSDADW